MIGQVKWPAYSAMNKMYQANSVNPKPFRHGNTELNSEKSDKRVESINPTSHREDDVLRTLWKRKESHRNDVIAYQSGYVATDCVMLMMVRRLPFCRVICKMNFPNSVNPKPFGHGNTEPSMSQKLKACVESLQEVSFAKDKDKFRTIWKHIELIRNELANTFRMCCNRISYMRRDRDDLISGRTWHRHLPLREHNWLVFD